MIFFVDKQPVRHNCGCAKAGVAIFRAMGIAP
jgi:hypothetical protein